MKTLYLARHSKAMQRKLDIPDFERTLVKSGEKDALRMAGKLKKAGHVPELLMSSTANRALETAHLYAKGLKYPVEKIMVKDALYSEMSTEALLYIIRQVDDRYDSVLVFGHNPVLTSLAKLLIENFHEDIPKSGVVGIEFAVMDWKSLAPLKGRLRLFEYPKRMAKTYKQLESDLEYALKSRIQEILARIDPTAAQTEAELVRKSSAKITEAFMETLKQTQTKEEKRALSSKTWLLREEASSHHPVGGTGPPGDPPNTPQQRKIKGTPASAVKAESAG
jgi:phosphohistidine phosphatase